MRSPLPRPAKIPANRHDRCAREIQPPEDCAPGLDIRGSRVRDDTVEYLDGQPLRFQAPSYCLQDAGGGYPGVADHERRGRPEFPDQLSGSRRLPLAEHDEAERLYLQVSFVQHECSARGCGSRRVFRFARFGICASKNETLTTGSRPGQGPK